MKKLLLTLSAVAMCGFASYAADVTLQAKDATDIVGTEVPEKPAEGDNNGQGRHFQPLESLKISEYSFTFSQGTHTNNAPAYYYPMSTNPNGVINIRLYAGNTMTITAPAGTEFASIKGYQGTTETVIYNGEKTNTYTYTSPDKPRFDKFIVSTEGGSTPPAEGVTFVKATALETGSYVFVCDGKLGTPAAAGVSYGRINLTDANISGDKITTDEANAFVITVADGKATIKDAEGRFYSMDDSHFTSFQFYTDENQYNYWTFAFEGDNVKFTNAVNTDCIICQSKGNQGTFYTNIAPAKTPEEFNLPVLYKKETGSGVANIAVENNGEAVYYNLQGVRVDNPTSGMYIVVKGGKSQKVAF